MGVRGGIGGRRGGAGDPGGGWRLLVSDHPPEAHRGHLAILEGGPGAEPVRAGDLAILAHRVAAPSRITMHANRVWDAGGETALFRQPLVDFFPDEEANRTWRLVPHPPGTPVEEPGETYLELTLGRGAAARIGAWNHSGTGQDWYEVLEPGRAYRVEVWLRASRRFPVRFEIEGFHGTGGRAPIRPVTFVATPEWKKHTATFVPRALQPGSEPGAMRLVLEGTGTVSIDNFRIFRDDAAWLDLLPRDYGRLADARLAALRTHAFVKSGRRSYDLAELTNPGGVASGTARQNTLPQTLAILERAGVDPWLQIEPHFAAEEWQGLVEYLAAPVDPANPAATPWAAKRAAQGRAAPWTEAFGRIFLEIGNETWNWLFAPWVFEAMTDAATGRAYTRGEVYGLFQEHVIATLRASPHWQAAGLDDKVTFVLGGWGGADYGRDAASLSPNSRLMGISAYNGGWDEGEGPPGETPASFFSVLNQVSQVTIPEARRHAEEAVAIGRAQGRPPGRALVAGTYEAGPGYALDGLNAERVTEAQAAAQERVMKSLAAGTATLDSFLARAAEGFAAESFFTFGEGRYWTSHARWQAGGQAYPAWALLALFNREATGAMLRVETRAVPRTDLPAAGWRRAVAGAPLLAAYATRAGDRLALVLVSRRVPDHPVAGDAGETAVTVDLPFARAARITRHRMTGAHDSHNLETEAVRIVAEDEPPGRIAGGRLEVAALPAGHAELWVFEGIAD
jgi:hypothetical protein